MTKNAENDEGSWLYVTPFDSSFITLESLDSLSGKIRLSDFCKGNKRSGKPLILIF